MLKLAASIAAGTVTRIAMTVMGIARTVTTVISVANVKVISLASVVAMVMASELNTQQIGTLNC
jgi:hypothetical protein